MVKRQLSLRVIRAFVEGHRSFQEFNNAESSKGPV
uniref:Uncharacterized protein n=1 Tax=Anguilla anguilla TaxID=7936 RepID=A0A0E9SKR2_ANGAN